jgi:type IV secretory pathway TraG/TraD family ATPase VirD4
MEQKTKRILSAALLGALAIAAGTISAPIAVPVVKSICTQTPLDGPALISFLANSGDWEKYRKAITSLAITPSSRVYFIAWLAIVVLALVLYALYRNAAKPSRIVDGESPLGNAVLIKNRSALKAKNDYWRGSGTPEHASLVLGGSRRGYLFDHSVPHWMVVGKTGSGKDQLQCIETIHLAMAADFNLLVTGKSELVELTGDKAVGLGYKRIVFDLNGYPGSSCFNPIDLISSYAEQGKKTDAQKTARQTAADLIPLGGETNTYFPKSARSALTAIILMVAYADIPREQKNMASVYDIVARGTSGDGKDPSAPLKNCIRALGEDHPSFGPAADFLSDGGMTTAGKNVLSTLKESLTIFGDEGIRAITAKSDVSMEDIIQQRSIVYFHLLEEGDPYQVLFTTWFNQYYRVASAVAQRNGGPLPRETALLGNEFGNLGKVSCLGEIATLGRSMKLHAWIFVQDLKQLNTYNKPGDNGAGRDKVLGSIGGKIALSLANPDDCEYFTKLAGKRTVRTHSSGEQRGGNGGARRGCNDSFNETSDDLIHSWELLNRVAARDGAIVVKGGENAAPGHEGVFEMPLAYANKTPAGAFFGLGSEEEEHAKRLDFYNRMLRVENDDCCEVASWCPAFGPSGAAGRGSDSTSDEFSAWD